MGKDSTLWPGCRRRAVPSLKSDVLENWLRDAPFALGALQGTVVLSLTSAREQWCEETCGGESRAGWGPVSGAAFSSLSPERRVIRVWTPTVWLAILPHFRVKKRTQLFFPFVYLKIITQEKTSGETSSSRQKKKSPGKKTAGSYFHIYRKVDLGQVITTFKNKLKELQRYLFFPTSLWFE